MTSQNKYSSTSSRTGIVVKNSIDFIRQVFEQFEQGNMVVNLRGEDDNERIGEFSVEKIIVPQDESGWSGNLYYPENVSDKPAQILFSSGTEGKSKAILLSHRGLSNTAERLIDVMEMDSSIKEYIGVPVHYSFGFGRCRAISKVNGKFYIPPNGFNPIEIAELLEGKKINAISAVPTLWRVLLQSKELFSSIGRALLWIEIGSQYMSKEEKEQLKSLFPNAKIIQHYGLTEASRSTFLKIHEVEGEQLESVGKESHGVETAITEAGTIKIRGPHLCDGLIKDEKLFSLMDAEGWLVTSDNGYLKNGFLYYEGRADDMINCGGIKLSPEQLEQALHSRLGIEKAIVVSKKIDPLRGEQPLIAYLNSAVADTGLLNQIAVDELKKQGVDIGRSVSLFSCDVFPVTETGKVQRKKVATLYEKFLAESKQPGVGNISIQASSDLSKSLANDEQAKVLVEIWEKALKISPISVDSSFFELGGDSLSAITVTIQMEKAGISKSTCRKMFQGLTIAELLDDQPKSLSQSLAEEVRVIWQDVLQITNIGLNDSFFDLGGDSLSAIRVATKMEKSGIPKSVVKRVFEGATIQIIVNESNVKIGNGESNKVEKITPIACGSRALNIVRGILVIVNIAAHWVPGVMARLPAFFGNMNQYLATFYSSGTPGFSIVFGAGVGFFFLPRYLNNPASLKALLFRNSLILGVGISCLAGLRLLDSWLSGETITGMLISNSFWVVLTYYFYALLSIPILLKIITSGRNESLRCIFLAVIFYCIHLLIVELNIPPSKNPLVQHFILILTTQYNYFEMSAGALLGLAFGIWIRDAIMSGKSLVLFSNIGWALLILSFVVCYEMGEQSLLTVWPKIPSLWSWPLYLGMVLILITTTYKLVSREKNSILLTRFINIISVFGVLAFPLFLTHEMVMPIKEILRTLSIPFALPIAVGLFLISTIYMLKRVYAIYFYDSKFD